MPPLSESYIEEYATGNEPGHFTDDYPPLMRIKESPDAVSRALHAESLLRPEEVVKAHIQMADRLGLSRKTRFAPVDIGLFQAHPELFSTYLDGYTFTVTELRRAGRHYRGRYAWDRRGLTSEEICNDTGLDYGTTFARTDLAKNLVLSRRVQARLAELRADMLARKAGAV